ncbi:tetratricopeptide repeat protein [Candidatus Electronema sp. JC]|uniref:tetratricopeptide repeat protein n=1 Tax=Candidatus Electronema sp. JC TaxID=3401570 RepID=UPI003AA8F95C
MSTVSQHIDGNGNTCSGSGNVQSNSFTSHGGPQNIGQGDRAIGQQNNTYSLSLSLPSSGEQGQKATVPRQLPALDAHFFGRDQELAELLDRLYPGKVVAICGPGGMGKSMLAAQAVHRLEPDRFPDGIVFHSFYHQPKVETALQAICAAFQIETKADLPTTVQQALSGKKALLILDGTENADDLPAILKLRGTCGVLITSRKRSDALTPPLILRPLGYEASEQMFRAYSGIISDAESVRRICMILDGWPVALRIAGRYLRMTGEKTADYLCWLEKEPFKELAGGQHQEENAALQLRRSVAQVSDDARLALGMAGTLAFAPFSREPVAAILDGYEGRCRTSLNELLNYGLLERRDERWQASHSLIHAYARIELPLSKESLERLATYYITFCQSQSKFGKDGYDRLDVERAHCLRLMESCLASRLCKELHDLVDAIYIYLDRRGYWEDKLTAVEMRLTAARHTDDRKDESWCLNSLGETYYQIGVYQKALAYYEQSLAIRRELCDREGEGVTLNNIGSIYWMQGKLERALQYYQQSLTIQREIGDRDGEGATLNNIGLLYMNQGDYATALQHYEQCLPIRREVGDKTGEGATLNNIAAIYRIQNDAAKALEYYEHALAIARELGDKAREMEISWNLGVSFADLGDLAKAEEYISHAVRIAETIGHPSLEKYRDGLAQVQAARRA